MVKVAEAIEYAHQRGVIHRDLKPANVLLDQAGNPRVTDFGLAKKREGDSGLTGSGPIMGTPTYMPPEQAGGKRRDVGPVSDVYALGATLRALITGRPPFQAATVMDMVLQVISDEPVPPRRLNPSIPPDVETTCLKCLEKEQGRRYSSAAAWGRICGTTWRANRSRPDRWVTSCGPGGRAKEPRRGRAPGERVPHHGPGFGKRDRRADLRAESQVHPPLQRHGLGLGQGIVADELHMFTPCVDCLAHDGGLRPLELVSPGDEFVLDANLDQVRRQVAGQRRLHPGCEPGRDLAGHRQPGQVEIPIDGDLGPRLHGRELAVAGVEQPGLAQQLADPPIQRQVQRVVGGIAGMDIAGQEQPARLGGGHKLDLGQVGAVTFALPQLHQAVVVEGLVAVAGGGVEADPLDQWQGVDLALDVPEAGSQIVPDRQITEAFQDQGEAVVAELDGPNGLADEVLEGVLEAFDPLLNVGPAVVGLREDVSDPASDELAVRETLVDGGRWYQRAGV